MLAAANDYFQTWQVPLILVFLFGWLVGGGYLFHVSLTKHTGRKVKFGRGVLVSLLSGGTGALFGGIAFYAGRLILPPVRDPEAMPISWFAVFLGLVVFLLASYLVLYAMHSISAKETCSACILPLGGTVLLAILIFVPSAFFANRQVKDRRQREGLQNITIECMKVVFEALRQRPNNLPAGLGELVKENAMDPKFLRSPANPSREIGFFYVRPKNGLLRGEEGEHEQILLCDYGDNHVGGIRIVTFINGVQKALPEEAFRQILSKPANADFAKALRQAEGGQ